MAPSVANIIEEEYAFNTLNHELNNSCILKETATGLATPNQILGKALVTEALKKRVEAVDDDTCDAGDEDTFFVADLGEVYRQHLRWKKNLTRATPHYAVKCNPDPQVLRLLAGLGTGFDCASKAEIEQVLKLGVDPSRIIYAQPCKTKSYIRYAAQQGVKQMTFDNAEELYKIKRFFPEAELFLRISTDDSASLCRLSLKFGASLDCTQSLLELAKDLDLNVTGVAFHVGSGASDPNAFLKAVTDARFVFDQAEAVGFSLRTLDVGGGFVSETFEGMAQVLSGALDEHFPPHVRIIGEPGRFYVAGAFTIACNIIARRTVVQATHSAASGEAACSSSIGSSCPSLIEDTSSEAVRSNSIDSAFSEASPGNANAYMIYLNDGVYGNFSSIMFDHQHPVPKILKCRARSGHRRPDDPPATTEITYSIWGPTCDGIDCISSECSFVDVLDVGDWLFFEDMGAYTKCSATRFNGFTDAHETIYISSEPGVAAIIDL